MAVDRAARSVTTADGETVGYDAPGARHRVVRRSCRRCRAPDLPGCFVYRTVDDVVALRDWVQRRAASSATGARRGGRRRAARARGGRCAASARRSPRTVVEFAPRLMALQVDEGGGEMLRRIIEEIGRRRAAPVGAPSRSTPSRRPGGWSALADGDALPVDIVVFATGVRPRDELAGAGRACYRRTRGGVVVDEACRTEDPRGLGDRRGRLHRAVAVWAWSPPATRWPRWSPTGCSAVRPTFTGRRPVDQAQAARGRRGVASATPSRRPPGALELVYSDPVARRLHEARRHRRRPHLLGGVLVGDASAYTSLRPMVGGRARRRPGAVAAARGRRRGSGRRPNCPATRDGLLVQQRHRRGHPRRGQRARLPRRGGRQGLHPGRHLVRVLRPAGQEAAWAPRWPGGGRRQPALCEHFALSPGRAVRRRAGAASSRTFSEIIARFGTRPRLRHLQAGRRLDPRLALRRAHARRRPAALQDTNDHVMANLQKDGTYSVVPRIPGGEITPEQLVAHRRRSPRTTGSTPRSPAASGSTCSGPGSSSCPRSGSGSSTAGSSRGTPTARRCAR